MGFFEALFKQVMQYNRRMRHQIYQSAKREDLLSHAQLIKVRAQGIITDRSGITLNVPGPT